MIKLTPDLEKHILASIRTGGFPAVAAQAWGVPLELFDDWLERGRASKAHEPYRSFVRKLEEAKAQARLKAETAAFKSDPKCWLQHGPGKEAPDHPGWSSLVKPIFASVDKTSALFASPEFLHFLAALRAVLAPYPEALAAFSVACGFDAKASDDHAAG